MSTPESPMSLDEMIRVMDVATEIRRQSATVEAEFAIEERKADLRERLQAAAQVTGEQLSTEQINLAIEWYFEHLHRFQEPPPGLKTWLAHAYIRRGRIAAGLIVLIMGGITIWWMSGR